MSIDNCQVCDKRLDTDHIEYQEDGTLLCDGCLDELEDEQASPVAEPGFTVEQQSSNRFTASQTSGTWISTDLGGTTWVSTELERMTAERDRYKALTGELAEALEHLTGPKVCWCEADTKDSRLQFHAWECNTARAGLAKYEQEQEKGV